MSKEKGIVSKLSAVDSCKRSGYLARNFVLHTKYLKTLVFSVV